MAGRPEGGASRRPPLIAGMTGRRSAPSVLPDISPSRGEIGVVIDDATPSALSCPGVRFAVQSATASASGSRCSTRTASRDRSPRDAAGGRRRPHAVRAGAGRRRPLRTARRRRLRPRQRRTGSTPTSCWSIPMPSRSTGPMPTTRGWRHAAARAAIRRRSMPKAIVTALPPALPPQAAAVHGGRADLRGACPRADHAPSRHSRAVARHHRRARPSGDRSSTCTSSACPRSS